MKGYFLVWVILWLDAVPVAKQMPFKRFSITQI